MATCYCSNCDGIVMLDETKDFISLAQVGVSFDGLTPGVSYLRQIKNKGVKETSFYCTHCKKGIQVEKVYLFCAQCGRKTQISNIKLSKKKGLVCPVCADEKDPAIKLVVVRE